MLHLKNILLELRISRRKHENNRSDFSEVSAFWSKKQLFDYESVDDLIQTPKAKFKQSFYFYVLDWMSVLSSYKVTANILIFFTI